MGARALRADKPGPQSTTPAEQAATTFRKSDARKLTSALPSSLPCCCDSISTRIERSENFSKTDAYATTPAREREWAGCEGATNPFAPTARVRGSTGAPKADVRARAADDAMAPWPPRHACILAAAAAAAWRASGGARRADARDEGGVG
jgi:hypothetical protein